MHDRMMRRWRWFWIAFALLFLTAVGSLYSMIFFVARYQLGGVVVPGTVAIAVILVVEALLVRSMMKSGRAR